MLNIGLVDVTGLDLKGSVLWRSGDWTLGATGRYSYQQALDHSSPESLTYGNQIPYIPLHSGSLDLSLVWKSLSISWDTTFTGERWSRSANTSDYHIEPWSTSDLALQYKPSFRGPSPNLDAPFPAYGPSPRNRHFSLKDHLTLSLRLSNIFDARYQIVQGYPMPGRSLLGSIEFSF